MLSLVKRYGLSHVCARSEFENIGPYVSDDNSRPRFNFPYLDIYIYQENTSQEYTREVFGEIFPSFRKDYQEKNIKFYFRGAKDEDLEFQNLFEYLLSTSLHGRGFFYCYRIFPTLHNQKYTLSQPLNHRKTTEMRNKDLTSIIRI